MSQTKIQKGTCNNPTSMPWAHSDFMLALQNAVGEEVRVASVCQPLIVPEIFGEDLFHYSLSPFLDFTALGICVKGVHKTANRQPGTIKDLAALLMQEGNSLFDGAERIYAFGTSVGIGNVRSFAVLCRQGGVITIDFCGLGLDYAHADQARLLFVSSQTSEN
jgi:hypothetical protein